MPGEGTPGGPEQPREDGALFDKEDVPGYVVPPEPEDPNVRAKRVHEQVVADDERLRHDREVRRFWQERGEIPPDPGPRERPYDEYGPKPRDRETEDMIWTGNARRGMPAVRAAMEQGLAEAAERPGDERVDAASDPHAVPKHAPERRALAARQVAEARGEVLSDELGVGRPEPEPARREIDPVDEALFMRAAREGGPAVKRAAEEAAAGGVRRPPAEAEPSLGPIAKARLNARKAEFPELADRDLLRMSERALAQLREVRARQRPDEQPRELTATDRDEEAIKRQRLAGEESQEDEPGSNL